MDFPYFSEIVGTTVDWAEVFFFLLFFFFVGVGGWQALQWYLSIHKLFCNNEATYFFF